MRRCPWLLATLLLLSVPAWGQSPARVQQDPSVLDACTASATATGAGNTAVTATLTPPSGSFVYVCTIQLQEFANTAVTASGTALAVTTSGLSANLTFQGDNSNLTLGTTKDFFWSFDRPLKTAATGTAFSVAWPATGQATQTIRLNITGYFAP